MRSGRQPDDAGDWPTRENNQTPIGEGKNSGAYKELAAPERRTPPDGEREIRERERMWWVGGRRGSEREVAEEAAEAESSSGAEATAKGKEQMALASSSDNERTANESTDNATENKGSGQAKKKSKRREKKVRRRAKVFRESTADLVDVRTLEMAMEFKPMPDQAVVLQVPEDVGSSEFLTIMQYADDVGYRIQNERKMMLRIMQRKFEEMKVEVSV